MSRCVTLTRYYFTEAERPERDLLEQLSQAESVVEALVTKPLHSYQQDALMCLVSDIIAGLADTPAGSFDQSFLLTALNKGMYQVAGSEFHTFCYVGGKVQSRAWEKRKAEACLFCTGRLLF